MLVIVFILAYIAWIVLGRAIVLLAMNDFIWEEFKDEWKDFDDEPLDIIFYIIFPITLVILWADLN